MSKLLKYNNRFHSIEMPWRLLVGMLILLPTFIFQPFTYIYGALLYFYIIRKR